MDSAPVTVAEIAQGGTQNAAVLQTGAQTGLANQFIGHAWLKPGSITITDTAKTISATDNGKGGFTGSGFSSGSVDYTTGNVTLVYNSTTPSSDTVNADFTWLGDDTFDVSQVDGYNVPVSITPSVATVDAEEMSFNLRICQTNSDCPGSPWYCDTSNNQCAFACTSDSDCGGGSDGQYPFKCDATAGAGKGVCYNSLTVAYECTQPGCPQKAGQNCAPQQACNWDLSKCPEALQIKSGSLVVGCTTPKDICGNNFSNGGFELVPSCSGGPGQGTCPAGLICNAASNGQCFTPIPCTGGPSAKGTCPQPSTAGRQLYCSAATNGFCFDAFQCTNSACPTGLTCNSSTNMCTGCSNSNPCPIGFTCASGGICVGAQGDCPPTAPLVVPSTGECAGSCTGAGQGSCPKGDLCVTSQSGQCAQPIAGFSSLSCYGTYNTSSLTDLGCTGGPGAQGDCPSGMVCSAGSGGSCDFPACISSTTSCASNLDCESLDGANTYTCVNGTCQGCPSGPFEVCNSSSKTCLPTNTSLHSCAGPNSTSCQISSGTYDACFSNADCPPNTACDLTAGDANEFTCVDNTSFTCSGSSAQTCPGPGVCDTSLSTAKCAVGKQPCTSNSQCQSPLVCDATSSTCEMPSYCGGPFNPQWISLVGNSVNGNYPSVFKGACPTAYSYAFDDGTSTFQCEQSAAGLFNGRSLNSVSSLTYVVTFCPIAGTLPAANTQKTTARKPPPAAPEPVKASKHKKLKKQKKKKHKPGKQLRNPNEIDA